MKVHTANLINAVILIVFSVWGYVASETPSGTAFIPLGFGIALLICYPWMRKHNRTVAHIAVVLTLLVLIGLIKPLTGALGRDDSAALFRVIVMMAGAVMAMVFFVKSFIDARKNRQAD